METQNVETENMQRERHKRRVLLFRQLGNSEHVISGYSGILHALRKSFLRVLIAAIEFYYKTRKTTPLEERRKWVTYTKWKLT
jgi:NADH:ubiquinone oxidoreductase subunit